MAMNITGDSSVSTLGVAHVYTLVGGSELAFVPAIYTDGVQTSVGAPAIFWSGDNTFDLRVGEYELVDGEFKLKNDRVDERKVTMIVDKDLHHQADKFRIYCSCYSKMTGWKESEPYKLAQPVEVMFEGQVGISVPPSLPDYVFGELEPSVHVIHDRDDPRPVTVTTPFFSTYPATHYTHEISYDGSSGFFWDEGRSEAQVVVPANAVGTNPPEITKTLTVSDWLPDAEFNGYVTISATGFVTRIEDSKQVAAAGYNIYIEYHGGAARVVKFLKANSTAFLMDEGGEMVQTLVPA